MGNDFVVDNQTTAAPESTPAPLVNPLLAESNEGQATQNGLTDPTDPLQQQQTSNVVQKLQEMGVTKFQDEDAFIKSYVNLEKEFSRTAQELAQLRQLNNQPMQQQFQQPQQQQYAPQAEQTQELSEEQLAELNEKFFETFYENPREALNNLVKDTVNAVIQPIQQKFQAEEAKSYWNQQTQAFAETHPDIGEYADQMAEVIKGNPAIRDNPNALDIAYNYVKGQRFSNFDPVSLLNDSNFVEKLVQTIPQNQQVLGSILQNPTVLNQAVQLHMQNLKQNQAPTVINSNIGGGVPMATPQNQPKTVKEATNQFLKFLNGK